VAELRVLDRITRPMQRLGYLKRVVRRVANTNTSTLDNIGHDLVSTVTRKVRVPLDARRSAYVKARLSDRAYQTLKQQTDAWLKNGQSEVVVSMEIQDLYLADPSLPSGVGKLVQEDWRKYPQLGVNLGLIRAGTYSSTTRALSFTYFTPDEEQRAFVEYTPEVNPLRLSQSQALLLLYSLLENDGEVVAPLWRGLLARGADTFTDRDAGNLLPEIYQALIARHRSRSLPADVRERLDVLEKSAESIANARQFERYTGGSAREESSRVRIEPYVDIGLFAKPDRFKYEYRFSAVGLVWGQALNVVESSQVIEEFLAGQFFATAASALGLKARPLVDSDEIVQHLQRAWRAIQSPGGYAPIEEMALVAGIDALLRQNVIIEPAEARRAIVAYQKAHPYEVRFTVDRMGILAHARFVNPLEPTP
jgi:hypothetical protein